MSEKKRLLVVSAHAADFVWRAGGTIANYTKAGHAVKVICLSFGQRGESESIWQAHPTITEDEVAESRKAESQAAAQILGCDISFIGLQDHYMELSKAEIMRLAKEIRMFQPDIVLTHSAYDPFNPDHDITHKAVLAALRSANVIGTFPDIPKTKQVEIFCFEPDQPDISGFMADVFIDISDVWDIKHNAMEAVRSQAFMVQTYGLRAEFRGTLSTRFKSGVNRAEFFKRITPYCGLTF